MIIVFYVVNPIVNVKHSDFSTWACKIQPFISHQELSLVMNRPLSAGILKLLTLGAVVLLLSACSRLSNRDLNGPTMGTTWTVKVVDVASRISADQLQGGIQASLDNVNALMSTYQADSELSRFNRSEPGDWFEVSQATWFVVKRAQQTSKLSGGSFDVTVGPLVNLWGFGPPGQAAEVPTQEQISETLARVGFQYLSVSEGAPYALKKLRPVYVDLSAIAKGFAVDQVAEYLETLQIDNYMVEVGGEVRVKGHNRRGTGWRIAIESPLTDRRTVQRTILPTNMGIATSGDYRNYFELEGTRYSHTIDPATGYPVSHNLVSVTVLMPTATDADALATAFDVMGAERALVLAEQEKIPVFLIVREEKGFNERYSSAFSPYLEPLEESSP